MFYIFLAPGFEETEALVPLDLLRRASINVETVGVYDTFVCGTHNITVKTDTNITEIDLNSCDGLMLPGGMPGTNNLYNSKEVLDAVMHCYRNGKLVCAICAAPLILGRLGLLNSKKAVCFPGFEHELKGADVLTQPSATDGNIITAKGAGAVFEFSKEIISYLKNTDTATDILENIQCSNI